MQKINIEIDKKENFILIEDGFGNTTLRGFKNKKEMLKKIFSEIKEAVDLGYYFDENKKLCENA